MLFLAFYGTINTEGRYEFEPERDACHGERPSQKTTTATTKQEQQTGPKEAHASFEPKKTFDVEHSPTTTVHQQRTVGDATTVGATSTCESTNQTSNQSNKWERERRETYRGHRHTANVGNVSNHHDQLGKETSERVQQGGRSDSMDSPSPEVDRRGKVRSHLFVRVGTHAHRSHLCEISVPRWW